jgi:hypothetical protein
MLSSFYFSGAMFSIVHTTVDMAEKFPALLSFQCSERHKLLINSDLTAIVSSDMTEQGRILWE